MNASFGKDVALVAGVDEAGCGPLAGPVVSAAVMFPSSWLADGLYNKLRGLNDSKQLDEAQREKFFNGHHKPRRNSPRHRDGGS